jgi:hypothetical protein
MLTQADRQRLVGKLNGRRRADVVDTPTTPPPVPQDDVEVVAPDPPPPKRQAVASVVRQVSENLLREATMVEGRRIMAAASSEFVGSYYLGLDWTDHQARWFELFDATKRLLLLSPRDHGKTESVCRVLALQRLLKDRNARVLIISKTATVARRRVDQMRRDLEENGRIVGDFGAFSPRARNIAAGRRAASDEKWTSSEFYVVGRGNARDPSCEGVGVLGAITGGHFDLIILDDPVEYGDAQSATKRDAVWEWFGATVDGLCEPHTQIVIIGTRKHGDDLYARLEEEDPTFRVHVDKAMLEWPADTQWQEEEHDGRKVIVGCTVQGGKSLWPERWSVDRLMLKYRANSVAFRREYQNELVDEESGLFKRVYFTGGETSLIPGLEFPGCLEKTKLLIPPGRGYVQPDGLPILQAWDLALVADKKRAEKHDSDFTVGITAAYDPASDTRYLLGLRRERGLLPSQVQDLIREEVGRFGPVFCAVENNNFGKLHELGLRATEVGRVLVPHHTGRQKADLYQGVPGLVSVLENGKWRLPYGDEYSRFMVRQLMAEFIGLGKEKHDDIVMAIWIFECLVRRFKLHLDNVGAYADSGGDGDIERLDIEEERA